MPPERLTASNPRARSASVTAAERPPERHITTIRRSRGSSSCRSRTFAIGMRTAPPACSLCHSSGSRTSRRKAPASTSALPPRAPTCGVAPTSAGASEVTIGNPAALQLSGSMTISAWINSAAFPSDDAAIVSKRDVSSCVLRLASFVPGPRSSVLGPWSLVPGPRSPVPGPRSDP